MPNPRYIKSYKAEADVGPYLLVKHGAADGGATVAAAATDAIMGVSTEVTSKSGDTVDVIKTGMASVKLGGTVTRGDPITSDANAKGVKANPDATVSNRIVGFADVSGVSGDVIDVLVSIGSISNATDGA